ncbi:25861_t:CDS:2, partial [Racocetra persica]
EENREKNIEGIMEGIMEGNTKGNMEENREGIIKGIVEENTERNTEENREGIIERNTEENMEKNAGESIEKNIANEKARMKLAIEELDNLLKKDDEHMDKGTKVHLQASLQYLRLRHQGWTKIHASATIASSLGWGDYKARLPKDNRGKFIKVVSLIDDERISLKVLKKRQLSVKEPRQYGSTSWDSTIRKPLLIEYDKNDLNKLVEKIFPNEMPHCVITHDETTLAANDNKKTGWAPESKQKLRPKGRGRCIHISEFLCEPLGRVHLTTEQHLSYPEIPNRYVTEILEVGANHDDYWNIQLLAKQLKHVIDILKIAHPIQSLFLEDALVASRMNVKYGEKQLRMHPGRLPD